MKTLNEWQYQIDAQGRPNYFFDTLIEASQKLHLELRKVQGFREVADLAMCINRILMELQHTGQVSDRAAWQCKYLCWKCEQFNESQWIYGNWGTTVKTEIKMAITAFLKLAEKVDKIPPTELGQDAKDLIDQGASAIKYMTEELNRINFWNEKVRKL